MQGARHGGRLMHTERRRAWVYQACWLGAVLLIATAADFDVLRGLPLIGGLLLYGIALATYLRDLPREGDPRLVALHREITELREHQEANTLIETANAMRQERALRAVTEGLRCSSSEYVTQCARDAQAILDEDGSH